MTINKKQLLILPFDHRSSFSKTLLGYHGEISQSQSKKISSLKKMVYNGFLDVISKYKDIDNFGILVDSEYGQKILNHANKLGVKTCSPVEKSGQVEFKFDHGNNFGKHIETANPTHVKVLVRYNPENKEINANQLKRLKKLSVYCQKTNRKLLFELLVPPTKKELEKLHGDKHKFDHTKRVTDTVKAIKEISKEIYVDVWKLEGMDTQKAWKECISAIKTGLNKNNFSIIVLGRGENKAKVIEWLSIAAKFKEVTGFAVGRTIFFKPLKDYLDKKLTKEESEIKIANNFKFFVNLWKREKQIKII
jgi:myo-inositol catabolism protein IolC